MMLVAMTATPSLRTPEWKPSPYQPMEILMAQQKQAREQAAAVVRYGWNKIAAELAR